MNGTLVTRRHVLRGGSALAGLAAIGASGVRRSDAAPDAASTGKVNIVTTSGSSSLVMNELMRRRGYLGRFGVEAQLVTVADGAKTMAALLSGDSDICVGSGFGQVLLAIQKGSRLKIIAGADLLPLAALFSRRPEIRTVHDLVGKTVATGSVLSLEYQLVTTLLKKKGIDPAKVTFVDVGGTTDIFRAVSAGTVDAGTGTVDVYEAQDRYGVHALTDGAMWSELPEFTNQATYCSTSAIASKRPRLVRTLAAYAELYRFIQSPDSKDAFVEAQLAALGKSTEKEALAQWSFIQKFKPYAADLVLSPQRIAYMQRLTAIPGKPALPVDEVMDMSLAQDALKLLRS